MDDPALLEVFGAALGLVPPWQVVSVEFDEPLGRIEIGLDGDETMREHAQVIRSLS